MISRLDLRIASTLPSFSKRLRCRYDGGQPTVLALRTQLEWISWARSKAGLQAARQGMRCRSARGPACARLLRMRRRHSRNRYNLHPHSTQRAPRAATTFPPRLALPPRRTPYRRDSVARRDHGSSPAACGYQAICLPWASWRVARQPIAEPPRRVCPRRRPAETVVVDCSGQQQNPPVEIHLTCAMRTTPWTGLPLGQLGGRQAFAHRGTEKVTPAHRTARTASSSPIRP